MGQRSQIYVRVDNELVIANYYQWNYAERMISRARYGIEYIRYYLKKGYLWYLRDQPDVLKLSRIFDVNFDYKDIALSTDILKEWEEEKAASGSQLGMNDFVDFVFWGQDNNDGQLYVWVDTEKKSIKYALTDYDGENPMTPDKYMEWEDQGMTSPYTERFKKSELRTYNSNKKFIEKSATLMTEAELEAFRSIDLLTVKTA